MVKIFVTFFIMAGFTAISFFGFEAWSDRKALQQGAEICGPAGVYDVDTTGFGSWVTCNDPVELAAEMGFSEDEEIEEDEEFIVFADTLKSVD
ncbi:MAG: hypothetical protein ACWA5L_10870 [bacterium]